MTRSIFVLATASLGLLIASVLGNAPLMAQEPEPEAAGEVEEIRVVAPRIVRERDQRTRGEVVTHHLSAVVSLTDLDLRLHADVLELESRIEEAASRICQQLARELPAGEPRTAVCIRRATEDAMVQAQELIHAAMG